VPQNAQKGIFSFSLAEKSGPPLPFRREKSDPPYPSVPPLNWLSPPIPPLISNCAHNMKELLNKDNVLCLVLVVDNAVVVNRARLADDVGAESSISALERRVRVVKVRAWNLCNELVHEPKKEKGELPWGITQRCDTTID
jgi:hypothetical protein